jgi:hypothetical protein
MKAQQLGREEEGKWDAEREQKIAARQAQIMKKHAVEIKALQKRIQTQIDSLRKQKALELEK